MRRPGDIEALLRGDRDLSFAEVRLIGRALFRFPNLYTIRGAACVGEFHTDADVRKPVYARAQTLWADGATWTEAFRKARINMRNRTPLDVNPGVPMAIA